MAKTFRVAAQILFVVSLPFALALSSLRWFALDPSNYVNTQNRQGVERLSGLTKDELASIDRALVRYFQSDRNSFERAMRDEGVVRSPFSDRDIAHLADVHDLIRLAMNVQVIAIAYALLFLVAAIMARARRTAARSIAAGSILTVLGFGALGVLSLLDWDELFLRFHFISFSNELWRLDPSRDALIRLYPPGFFLDATMQLVSVSVGEAVILAGLAWLVLRRDKRRRRRAA